MPNLYVEILIQDDLSESPTVCFDGLQTVKKAEGNCTFFTGEVADYSALYGLLERIRDLNLHLLSVQVKSIHSKGITK
jgi:hypothetical protein